MIPAEREAIKAGKHARMLKLLAELKTLCPKCGYVIPPAEIGRFDFNTVKCPVCGEHFVLTKANQA